MSDKKSVFKRIRSSALIKNPLLFEAVGLCPVVAIATSVEASLFLSIITTIEMILCEVLASLSLKNVRRYWRVALYVVFGIIVIFPITYITKLFFPDLSMNVGVYLPLMAVNSLIALHCERVAVKNSVKDSFVDALSASLSYGVVAIIVGLLREILANGTIWGHSLNMPVKFLALRMPFGGLLILGFLAAALKGFLNKKYPDSNPDKAFDQSEIRRSLRGTLKELMNDEFNPYGEENDAEAVFVRTKKERKKKAEAEVKEKTAKAKKNKPRKKQNENISETKIVSETTETKVEGRTYLDDFSDMLSELEEYKNRNNGEDTTDGGDGE